MSIYCLVLYRFSFCRLLHDFQKAICLKTKVICLGGEGSSHYTSNRRCSLIRTSSGLHLTLHNDRYSCCTKCGQRAFYNLVSGRPWSRPRFIKLKRYEILLILVTLACRLRDYNKLVDFPRMSPSLTCIWRIRAL